MKIQIDQKITATINQLAAMNGMSPESLVVEMLTLQVKNPEYWQERAEDMAALETMQNGNSISHDDMKAHFQELRSIALEKQ